MEIPNEVSEDTQLTSKKFNHAFGLIITPTRELALQIKKHLDMINMYTKKLINVSYFFKLYFIHELDCCAYWRHVKRKANKNIKL